MKNRLTFLLDADRLVTPSTGYLATLEAIGRLIFVSKTAFRSAFGTHLDAFGSEFGHLREGVVGFGNCPSGGVQHLASLEYRWGTNEALACMGRTGRSAAGTESRRK